MVCKNGGEKTAGFRGDCMKDRIYTVSQDKNGYWYVHKAGYPYIPCFGTFHKQKKSAQKDAAMWMGIPLKDYMKLPERKGVK